MYAFQLSKITQENLIFIPYEISSFIHKFISY